MKRNAKVLALLVIASMAMLLLSGSFAGISSKPHEERVPDAGGRDPNLVPPNEFGIDDPDPDGADADQVLFKVRKYSSGTNYLRYSVCLDYTDGKWTALQGSSVGTQGGLGPYSDRLTSHRMVITPVVGMEIMPVPKQSYGLEGGGVEARYHPWSDTVSARDGAPVSEYAVDYQMPSEDPGYGEGLANAVALSNPGHTKVPADLMLKVKNLAKGITEGKTTDYGKAKAISDYLRGYYVYDLEFGAAPAGVDPIDWFLFKNPDRDGTCLHFNSAFVMLARSLGMSARLVNGFLLDPGPGSQDVTVGMGHAYAEVEFEGIGWVIFDATGSSGPGEPDIEDPGIEDPGTGEPDIEDPGTGEPDIEDPGTGEPGTGEPGSGGSGSGGSGTGEPGTGEPGTGDSGTGDPGSGGSGILAPPTVLNINAPRPTGDGIPQVLFRVHKTDAGAGYLRYVVCVDYAGDGEWEAHLGHTALTQGRLGTRSQLPAHEITVEPTVALWGAMPIPCDSYYVRAGESGAMKYHPWSEVLHSQALPMVSGYTVEYHLPLDDQAYLDGLATASATSKHEYTQVPAGLKTKLGNLARQITEGKVTDYEKAVAVSEYLRENYSYNVEYNGSPQGVETLDWFLFGNPDKDGVCGHFNSAFVMLVRSLGMSARLVGGFAIDPGPGTYDVVEGTEHSYAEVEFDGIGWVIFDAVKPSGWGAWDPGTGEPGTAGPGTGEPTRPGSVSGTVYHDKNGNGRMDAGEAILDKGYDISLRGPFFTYTHDHYKWGTRGQYSFDNLPPGKYLVNLLRLPSGWIPASSTEATVEVRGNDVVLDFRIVELVPTETEITSYDRVVEKRREFLVGGTVVDDRGNGVSGLTVRTYVCLKADKETPGNWIQVGSAMVSGGVYSVASRVPDDLPLGNYQLIAATSGGTIGGVVYGASDSDPEIAVKDATDIAVHGPGERLAVGVEYEYAAVLTEATTGKRIPGALLDIWVNGVYHGHMSTDADGTVRLSNKRVAGGPFNVYAYYGGSATHQSSSGSEVFQAIVPKLTECDGISFVRGEANRFSARLADAAGVPLDNHVVNVKIGEWAFTTSTDPQGRIMANVDVPDTAPNTCPVHVSYWGDPIDTKYVKVITRVSLQADVAGRTVSAILTGGLGNPVPGKTIDFHQDGSHFSHRGDSAGRAEHSLTRWSKTVKVVFAGDEYHTPAEAAVSLVPESSIEGPGNTLVRGESNTVRGSLKFNGLPVQYKPVTITMAGAQWRGATGAQGDFSTDVSLPAGVALGSAQMEIRMEGEICGTHEFYVKARSTLQVEIDGTTARATLLDDAGDPIHNMEVRFEYGESTRDGRTDISGVATHDMGSRHEEVRASYPGGLLYIGSSATATAPSGASPYPWLAIAVVAIVAVAAAIAWRRHSGRPIAPPPGNAVETLIVPDPNPVAAGYALSTPQANTALPNVWGFGEAIVLEIRGSDGEVAVAVNGEETVVVAEDGAASLPLELPLGRHVITVSGPGGTGQMTVCVVDYREEVVRRYNEALESWRAKIPGLDANMTSREVGGILLEKYPGSRGEVLESIRTFERVNYGGSAVTRADLESMHSALGGIGG